MEGERTDPAASITFYHPRHRLCGAVLLRMPIPSRFPESFILETCTPPLRQRTAPSMAACLSLSLITLWQVVILALDLQLPCSHPQAHPVHPRWNISSPLSPALFCCQITVAKPTQLVLYSPTALPCSTHCSVPPNASHAQRLVPLWKSVSRFNWSPASPWLP